MSALEPARAKLRQLQAIAAARQGAARQAGERYQDAMHLARSWRTWAATIAEPAKAPHLRQVATSDYFHRSTVMIEGSAARGVQIPHPETGVIFTRETADCSPEAVVTAQRKAAEARQAAAELRDAVSVAKARWAAAAELAQRCEDYLAKHGRAAA